MEDLKKESKEEAQNKFVMATLKLLKGMFGKNGGENGNFYDLSNLNLDNSNLPNSLKENKMAENAIDIHRDILSMVNDFSEKNKDELSKAISENRLSDVSNLIKNDLVNNIQIYIDSFEMDEGVLSDPLRRVPQYRQGIIDNIDAVFSDELSGSVELRGLVNNAIESKVSDPSLSHNETTGTSPRVEYSLEVSNEVRNEMMADVPSLPTPSAS
jgi:hypothetical protein